LPVEDLDARFNTIGAVYARSFRMFNKLAKMDVILPFAMGTYERIPGSTDTSVSRRGFGDPYVRLSMVLIGSKPVSILDFPSLQPKKFNLGVSLRTQFPMGQYDPSRIINLGTNRWAFKPAIAASYTIRKKLIFEGHFSAWIFTENNSFSNGNTVKQKPLISAQIHAAYLFTPKLWLAAAIGGTGLGETILNGVEQDDLQRNSKFGTTGMENRSTKGFSESYLPPRERVRNL
jgi:hypothetical protein